MYELILETAYPSLVSENIINGTMEERDYRHCIMDEDDQLITWM